MTNKICWLPEVLQWVLEIIIPFLVALQRRAYAAELGSPFVKRRATHAVLTTKFGNRYPIFGLL